MSVQAWADTQRGERFFQEEHHQRAINTLQSLLEGKTDPDSAARTIASIFEPQLHHRRSPMPLDSLWVLIGRVAVALGGDKDIATRQIDFLNCLSELPDVTDRWGTMAEPGGSVYWRDLPGIAVTLREEAFEYPDEDGWEDSLEVAENAAGAKLNVITFGAMYLVLSRHTTSLPTEAEGDFRDGLEDDIQTLEDRRFANVLVPLAATWMLIAGEQFHKLCKTNYCHEVREVSTRGKQFLWGESTGYSLARWAFWKKRFAEIATMQELENSVKDTAARAASEMERIEIAAKEAASEKA